MRTHLNYYSKTKTFSKAIGHPQVKVNLQDTLLAVIDFFHRYHQAFWGPNTMSLPAAPLHVSCLCMHYVHCQNQILCHKPFIITYYNLTHSIRISNIYNRNKQSLISSFSQKTSKICRACIIFKRGFLVSIM